MSEQNAQQFPDDPLREDFPKIDARSEDASAGMSRERKLATYAEDLWWLGWSDGGSGQPSQHGVDVIATQAEARRRLRLRSVRAQAAGAKARREAADELATSIATTLTEDRAELTAIEAKRRENPHEM